MLTNKNLNTVDLKVKVGDTECDCEKVVLHQSMTSHHRFEVWVNYRARRENVWILTADEVMEQIGSPLTITLTHLKSTETTVFQGYITDVEVGGKNGDQGYAILRGGSPTLILDRDPSMDCFADQTLRGIISEVVERSGVPLKLSNNPRFETTIPYVARYKETSWQFLSRVVRSYGEWFYYDGRQLVVGEPTGSQTQNVTYDLELREMRITSSLRPLNGEVYDYDPGNNDYFNDAPPENIDGKIIYMQVAQKHAKPFYPQKTLLPTERAIVDEADVVGYMRARHSRDIQQMYSFSATSATCAIRLGEMIYVTLPKSMTRIKLFDIGRFRVTEITHTYENQIYRNEFKGVAGSTEFLPLDEEAPIPTALPEVATVTDNQDPRHQGRVRVRFMWQDETDNNAASNWIRVQTPDAGSSDNVARNRGFVFIPESGDQVMVGFEKGDPSRPFVMGSLFHRDNTTGAEADNTLKTIRTRSGHTLEFNDDEQGLWGITIKDRNGCVIEIDTKGKNINISTPETMTFNAKNISINATESLFTSSGENTSIQVGKNFEQNIGEGSEITTGKSKSETIGEDLTCTVNGNLTATVTKDISQQANAIQVTTQGAIQLSAQDKLTLKSGSEVVIAQ